MQELSVQPTNPTPYMPAGGTYNFNPTPGAGGLPALSGLSRNMNPLAQELQSQGRGQDSMLVHMTPDEVNDLQTLAMHHGTTMTVNPNTGLPEAGLLGSIFKKLLPSLIGAGLMFIPGVNALAAAGIVGGGSTLLTGSLKKGLMAGLQAYGGASLARGLGAGVKNLVPPPGGAGVGSTIAAPTRDSVSMFGSKLAGGVSAPGVSAFAPGAAGTGLTTAANAGTIATGAAKTGIAALPRNFAAAARSGVPGFLAKGAPYAAGLGLINTASGVDQAIQQNAGRNSGPVEQSTWVNEGPYMPTRRRLAPRLTGPDGRGEIMYYDEPDFGGYLTASGQLRGVPGAAQPQSYASQGLLGFAEGGLTLSNTSATNDSPARDEYGIIPANTTDTSKMTHRELTGRGYVDPVTGVRSQLLNHPFAFGIKAGATSSLGGNQFRVTEEGEWEYVGPNPTGRTGTNTTTTTRGTGSNTSTNTSTSSNTASNVSTTGSNTATNTTSTRLGYDQDTPTSKTDGLPPGATPSGYGIYTLADKYVPQFTTVADFVTDKVNPYTGGTEQTNKLEEYIRSYQTSPGPITASVGYAPGQSPSQRNRAYALQLAREAEARRRAEEAATNTTTTTTGANVTTGTNTATNVTGTNATTGATNFFFDPANNAYFNNVGLTGDMYDFDPVTGTYRRRSPSGTNSGSGSRDTTGTINMNAKGGSIRMDDGAFVVDARTVSELGNGSSSAGQELLARLGGRPVKGPGDGVSDSIRANIGGRQEARVARDEVIFPAAAVKKLGGAKKLYALMDKAHKARKKAGRGSDTKLRKGLGAL